MKKRVLVYTASILLIIVIGGIIVFRTEMIEWRRPDIKSPTGQKKLKVAGIDRNLVFVSGGSFTNMKSNLYGKNITIPDFYIGKYEVTQKEWVEVMGSNPSTFRGDNLPVEMVNWYDCITYCNKRSVNEGLRAYYTIDQQMIDPDNKNDYDSVKWRVTVNEGASGYRLPTEAEWEYAAGGGRKSKNFACSGSDKVDEVAWYWRNSGDKILTGDWNWVAIENNNNKTWPVGSKKPNELGLYDMSGNVREWCWDWYKSLDTYSGYFRALRGGGWLGGEHACISSFRGKFEASGRGSDQGFRVCRNFITNENE
jgi:formylglycine-generating enzyme required for sulfatase activity